MVLEIVNRVIIKILPFYIATTFAELSYEGVILSQFPVFIKVILIVIVGHYIWLALLYALGGIFSKTNPMEVLKHYPPAYITAIGTALILSIFALQDSFGTACNITGDGAIALMVTGLLGKVPEKASV